MTEYRKTTGASIIGSYKILDVASARIKKSESFNGTSNFSCEWDKFTGDERALSRHSRSLVSNTEGYAPPAEELVNRAGKDLCNSLAATLISYAK